MKSPMKYKGLKLLIILVFFITASAISVAQNGNEESDEVSTIPDMNGTTNYDDSEQNGTSVVVGPPMNSALNEDLERQEVSTILTAIAKNGIASMMSAEQEDTSTTLEERMKKTISVDFKNTPIEDVIRMIAEQADVDIITSPTVTGYVTATLTNVPLKEALKSILRLHGYGCVIDKNMISVVPVEEIGIEEERTDTRVYHITYADVADVEAALKKFLSKRGTISSSPGTSDIIVKDSESNIKAMDSFIEKVDRITPQVLVEVRIYDVTSTEGFDIGADWTAGRNTPISTIDHERDFDLTKQEYETASDSTKNATTAWQENTAGLGTSSYLYRKSKPFVGGEFETLTGGTIRLGLLDTMNVEIALSVLRTEVGAKLLANPRILVLDNETADFKIISEIPYTEQSTTGSTITDSVKFKNVGVELQVKPHVTRDGMIRLDISPEFSVRVGTTSPPTVDKREVDTKALVKDGQTVVLGGLRKREVTQEISKVPLLGDVPILGQMFSDVEEEVKTNELIIFITPTIVIEPSLTQREVDGYERTNFGGPTVNYARDEKDDD